MTVLQRYLDRKIQPDMFAVPAPSYDEFAGPAGVRDGWRGLAHGLDSFGPVDLERARLRLRPSFLCSRRFPWRRDFA